VTVRRFAVDDVAAVAHDPCTGLTHDASGLDLDPGRALIDDSAVVHCPVVAPRQLDRDVPVSVCWSPIVRCNLSCPHCLDDKSLSAEGLPRRREIASIIAGSGVLGVDISGGEPLLMREVPELVRLLQAGRRCAVSITTNGWLLARRAAELAGVADAVRVSLDGPDAASHDAWRGEGSFRRALEGIGACTRLGIAVQIQTVLMASNRHRAQAMVRLASDAGAGGLTFLQMLPIGEGAALGEREALTDDDARSLVGGLQVPAGLHVRLRERDAAGGFTVIRADGMVWRNLPGAASIRPVRRLVDPGDLATAGGRDGSA
jgi:sulfatase maturation enzyme AslB (radical SAM superfamily)